MEADFFLDIFIIWSYRYHHKALTLDPGAMNFSILVRASLLIITLFFAFG